MGIAWNEAGVVSTAGYSITILPPQETVITVEALVENTMINLGDTARLTVNVNGGDGTEKITVDVNGKTVTSNTNVYEYTPDSVGEYAFNVTVETSSGNSKTVSVSFNVTEEYDPDRDVSAPVVEFALDKESYFEGDDIIVTVKAEDNVGVTKTEVTVNGSEISPEANGKYVIKNAAVGTYEIKATAYDAAGNSSWKSASVPVNAKGSEPSEDLTLDVYIDANTVEIGKTSDIIITAAGGVGEKTLSCTVNGNAASVVDSKAEFTPDKAGEYVIAVSAVDEAGNRIEKTVTLNISEGGTETEEKNVSVMLIINGDRINDGNHNESKVGEEVSVYVEIKNLPDNEIESLTVTVNGEAITLDRTATAPI